MEKKIFKLGLSLLFVVGVCIVASAQTGPPIGGVGPTGCFPPPCIPVDGGLSLLIAAAIGIGGKKAYEHSKQA